MKKAVLSIPIFILALSFFPSPVAAIEITPNWDGIKDGKDLVFFNRQFGIKILDRNGRLITNLQARYEAPVEFINIPKHLIDALVATEDKHFFAIGGFAFAKGIARALFSAVVSGQYKGGGSTITQQVVKNLFYSNDHSDWQRKLTEPGHAARLNFAMSEKDVLYLYLNRVYFGNNQYGMEAAARFYFGIAGKDLTILQSAMLVGMLRSPESLNPYLVKPGDYNGKAARGVIDRVATVLSLMREQGYLSDAQYRKLVADAGFEQFNGTRPPSYNWARFRRSVGLIDRQDSTDDVHRALQNHVCNDVIQTIVTDVSRRLNNPEIKPIENCRKLTKPVIRSLRGIYRVYTTIDLGLQTKANRILDEKLDIAMSGPRLDGPNQAALVAISNSGEILTMAGLRKVDIAPGVKYDPRAGAPPIPQLAPPTAEPKDQAVILNSCGRLYSGLDVCRQVGSLFKIFPYLQAIVDGARLRDTVSGERFGAIRNHDDQYPFSISLRDAFAQSINTAAVRLAERRHPAIIELARKMGISSPIKDVGEGLALGVNNMRMFDIVAAYGVVENGGRSVSPYYLQKIANDRGEIVTAYQPSRPVQVIQPQHAKTMRELLGSVFAANGTAAGSAVPKAGGKTGTTNDYRDAWFVGVMNGVATGIWYGNSDNAPMPRGTSGSGYPAHTWKAFTMN